MLGPVKAERTPPSGAKWHPYADLFPLLAGHDFPLLAGHDFDELVADIKANGVLEPIVRLDGQILDGRHRYLAARELQIAYPVVEYLGDDPLGFVIGKNMVRRHLSESQRAIVAAKLARLPRGRHSREKSANLRIMTQADAAAAMKVSTRSVQMARRVERDGVPELTAAVEDGHVSVSAAAELAQLPGPEQIEALHEGAAAVKRRARHLRVAAPDVSLPGDAIAMSRHLEMLEAAWSASTPTERQTFMNRHGLLYAAGQIDVLDGQV